MFVRAYLRASTDEQDASRARDQLQAFATERGLQIASWYVENESGTKLARPELFRLLANSQPGDVLMVEQVDRLSRLTTDDWQKLKADITAKGVRVVALDLPTSWMMASKSPDEFTARMFEAINGMLLDMLAAVARKDYEDRRRRQKQGQAKAKRKAATRVAQKTLTATQGSPACWLLARRGARSRASPAAAVQPSLRSPNGTDRRLDGREVGRNRARHGVARMRR